jgi:formate hydrogenlyase subunit 6/NADH:ubiquinone oxidoreductase subunit I
MQAPRVDYGACIRCYCCHEVCPADAISLARRP